MKKRYIIGATAALISAGLTIEAPAASSSLTQFDGLEAESFAAGSGAKGAGLGAGLGDEDVLLADSSPWAELPPGEGRPVWDRIGARMVMMPDEFGMVGQDDNSYPLAGPINAAHGGDALAAALSQPVNFSTVPEPGNWLSMIVGLALVGYTLRRRNRVPTVSS